MCARACIPGKSSYVLFSRTHANVPVAVGSGWVSLWCTGAPRLGLCCPPPSLW